MRFSAPKWLDDAVFYEIYPQTFYDTNADGIGDLQGIIEKLDYIKSLHVNALWLNPIFDSPFCDAGYDIRDFYKVAERYGTNDDLKRLFDEAHKKGIRVLLDLVAGHSSLECEWFKKSCEAKPNKYSNYYMWSSGWWDNLHNFRFISGYPSERDGYYMINFFYCQPALNYGFVDPIEDCAWQLPCDHPDVKAVREELRNIMKFYLDMGCDGFRVDMASSLVRANDPAKRHQGLVDLWQDYRAWMKTNYPEAILVSEWSSPVDAVSAGFDLDFFLSFHRPGYNSLFRNERIHANPGSTPKNYVEKKFSYFDEGGRGSVNCFLDEMQEYLRGMKGLDGYFSLVTGNHDSGRIRQARTLADLKVAYTFLLTLPGAPFVYYGDEIGMDYVTGLPNREGSYNRNGSRTPMQWEKGPKAGFSTASPKKFYLPIDLAADRPTVEAQEKDADSLLNYFRKLTSLRRSSPALATRGEFAVLANVDGGYPLVYERTMGRERYVIAVNPSNRKVKTEFGCSGKLQEVLSCGSVKAVAVNGAWKLEMSGVSAAIFKG